MAVSRALRRLVRLRALEQEQARLALEAATVDLRRLEKAQAAALDRNRRGRRMVEASARGIELPDPLSSPDRLSSPGRLLRPDRPASPGRPASPDRLPVLDRLPGPDHLPGLDRLAGLEESRAAERLTRALTPRLADAALDAALLTEDLLAARVQHSQAATLLAAAQAAQALDAERRAQQALDEWFRNRQYRAAGGLQPSPSGSDRTLGPARPDLETHK